MQPHFPLGGNVPNRSSSLFPFLRVSPFALIWQLVGIARLHSASRPRFESIVRDRSRRYRENGSAVQKRPAGIGEDRWALIYVPRVYSESISLILRRSIMDLLYRIGFVNKPPSCTILRIFVIRYRKFISILLKYMELWCVFYSSNINCNSWKLRNFIFRMEAFNSEFLNSY